MKRKQKRYASEEEILRAIKMAKGRMSKLRVKLATTHMTDEQVVNATKAVRCLEDSTIPNLVRTLAAFNTRLLPGITDDPAVVLVR